ncbi:alpha/beta fold hydrolase [Nocardioides carbamazepini]|uniref:alpha/beta fold hydrolase n=1 Tax=Nocardioides carbamazepini TaxID=2854259 RepID=UPI00214A800D|nr:alpha/beta fold hydrolase [Nocardioides carbamazepini]MCR1782707.1 alpha/beta fold hydrolase [Nocardioides carbamazepini]
MSIWNDYTGSEVRMVRYGGIRTRTVITPARVADHGAPPVLMLHGRGGHLESFHRNVPALSAGRALVSLDLLGHGLTEQAGSRYDVGEIADHLAHAMTSLDDGRGFDVVAQSLGAWAVLHLLATRSPSVRRLALIEPAGLQTHAERMSDPRVRTATASGGRAFDDPSADNVRLRFAQLLHDQVTLDEELVDLRRRLYALPGAAQVHRAVRTADNEPHVVRPESLVPADRSMLFLRGEHGHLPSALLDDFAGRLPDAQVVTIPGAKQWPHYERPDLVNTHLLRHLER